MERHHGERSTERLISPQVEEDATTIHNIEIEEMPEIEQTHCGIPGHCNRGSMTCQGKELQLPATARTIYESWTIVFQRPTKYTRCWAQVLGCTVGKTMATEPGRIVVVRPNTHFAQDNLANVLICAREQHQPRSLVKKPRAYEEDLEYRLRRLDWTVQDELYALLRDRSESASSPFRRREYKLAVLLEVVGGEMTDAAGGGELVGTRNRWWWLGGRRRRRRRSHKTTAPHVEYRLVLRGSEVKANDAGWGGYHRYSQPWREADRAGLHCETEKAVYQGLLG